MRWQRIQTAIAVSAIVAEKTMSFPTKGFTLLTNLAAISWMASSAAYADDVGTYAPQKRIVATHHPVRAPIKANTVALNSKDCSPLIYDYGNKTETKMVCSPPWTGPSADAETGPSGSSSSAAQ